MSIKNGLGNFLNYSSWVLAIIIFFAPFSASAIAPPLITLWSGSYPEVELGGTITLQYSVKGAILCEASVDPLSVGAGSWYGTMPFEDGIYHREIIPQVVGVKTYIITCYSSRDDKTSKSLTISVVPNSNASNKIPTAKINQPTSDQTVSSGTLVNFSGSGTDSDGTIKEREWRLGGCGGTLIANGSNFSQNFTSSATISFRVKDNLQAWSTNCPTVMIMVSGSKPTCTMSYDKEEVFSGEDATGTWRSIGDADGRLEYSCTNFSEGDLNPCTAESYCGTIKYNGTGRSGLIKANSLGSATWDNLGHDRNETCTFTAENASGQKTTCSDTLVVKNSVSCTTQYDKSEINAGESATLMWNSVGDADGKLKYSCTNFSEGDLKPCVGGYCGTIKYNGTGRSGLTKASSYGIAIWDSLGHDTSETCTFTAENASGQKATCNDTLLVKDPLICTANYNKPSIYSGERAIMTVRSTGDADDRLEYSCTNFGEPTGGWKINDDGYNGTITYNGIGRGGGNTVRANGFGYATWVNLGNNTSETCTFTARNELGVEYKCWDTLLVMNNPGPLPPPLPPPPPPPPPPSTFHCSPDDQEIACSGKPSGEIIDVKCYDESDSEVSNINCKSGSGCEDFICQDDNLWEEAIP